MSKPQGNRIVAKYNRYLSKNGASDIWARELLNGMFDIDDRAFSGTPVEAEVFLSNYELFEEL